MSGRKRNLTELKKNGADRESEAATKMKTRRNSLSKKKQSSTLLEMNTTARICSYRDSSGVRAPGILTHCPIIGADGSENITFLFSWPS